MLAECRGVAGDVFLFAHEGYGFVAAVERYMDYLGALGNEDAFAGFIFATQLRFCERAEELASGMVVFCFCDAKILLCAEKANFMLL